VPGESLETTLLRRGVLSEVEVRFYVAQVIFLLSMIHSKDVVFRDLKPGNLLLGQDGYLRLVDFGLAAYKKPSKPRLFTFCGTPEYMAPEIVEKTGHSFEVDYWSLGIAAYELLCGTTPSGRLLDEEDMRAMVSRGVHPLRWDRRGTWSCCLMPLSPESRDFVAALLQKNPFDRLVCLPGASLATSAVAQHKWLKNWDWEAMQNRRMKPPLIPLAELQSSTPQTQSQLELTDELSLKEDSKCPLRYLPPPEAFSDFSTAWVGSRESFLFYKLSRAWHAKLERMSRRSPNKTATTSEDEG